MHSCPQGELQLVRKIHAKKITNNTIFLITESKRQVSDKIIKIIVVPRKRQLNLAGSGI